MWMKEYLIYCPECDEYTALGQYLSDERRFQGEYSLLHNRHANDNDILCRFLIKHLRHQLWTIPNLTEEFAQVIRGSHRFLDREIDDHVLESHQYKQYQEEESKRQLQLSQLHFHVIETILEEEAKAIANIPTQTPAESQFWLGKEQGVKRAVELLKEWADRLKE